MVLLLNCVEYTVGVLATDSTVGCGAVPVCGTAAAEHVTALGGDRIFEERVADAASCRSRRALVECLLLVQRTLQSFDGDLPLVVS